MKKAKNVDSYIKSAPKEVRAKLKQMRAAIKSVAPKAKEKISYGMPYYSYNGRLAYFSFAKKHIGLYVMQPAVAENKKYLKGYSTTKVTVRFPLNKKLPVSLIKRLIKSRIKYAEKTKANQRFSVIR